MIDFNLSSNTPIAKSDVDLILQQIDIQFDTLQREVLGYETWGTKYHEYLYRLNMSNDDLKRVVEDDLRSINLMGFSYNVGVYFLKGSERDIALVDIVLTRGSESYNRTYKIS